jgi:hypothetical protein
LSESLLPEGVGKKRLKNNGTRRRNSQFSRITNHKIQTHADCRSVQKKTTLPARPKRERERERGTKLLLEKYHTASPEYFAIFRGKKTHMSPYSLLTILIYCKSRISRHI